MLVFSYGSLQTGFPNYDPSYFRRSLGLFKTAIQYPLIVPQRPACPNPGCRFKHRFCALVNFPGNGLHVYGEVFEIADGALPRLDALENYTPNREDKSTYLRRPIRLLAPNGRDSATAEAYFIKDATTFWDMLHAGEASFEEEYTLEMATGQLKDCCRLNPQHTGAHDVHPLGVVGHQALLPQLGQLGSLSGHKDR